MGFGGSSSNEAGGIGNSAGKCLWNASTAVATPSSFSICFANSMVHILTSISGKKKKETNRQGG